ncbi:MAG TPA: hypothetical protein VES67_10015 [Vicinamibacterales bacterium]|nr:hypothetical protein [Vicinamibacterales bacterium]
MRKLSLLSALTLAVALAAACANQKAPAEAALKSAQDAYNAVSADAQKYVPDQARAIQDSLASAQAALGKGDYAVVLTQAQALNTQIAALGSAIAAKKAELTTTWTTMSAGVPKLVEALKSRVDILSQSKRLPAGVTKDALDSAKAGVATASQTWSEATAAATIGDVATAVAKATAVRASVVNLMQVLNMQVPAAAGSL